MLPYGGGGHANAGTCQVAHEDTQRVLCDIALAVNADPSLAFVPQQLSGRSISVG